MHKRSLSLILLSFLLTTATVGAEMSDKTRTSDFGLHGPVKQTIERTTYPAGLGTVEHHSTTTTSFGPDGVVREMSWQVGDMAPSSRIFDHGEFSPEMLQRMAHHHQVDSNGRKTKTRKLPRYELRPDMAIGAIPWEDSEIQFTPPSEGSVTTIYDDRDRPKEGEVRDAAGQIVLRITRTYDEKGRVRGDKIVEENTSSVVPEEITAAPEFSQLSADQKKAFAKALVTFTAKAFNGGESSFQYDDQGRVVEKHVKRGNIQDEITKTAYNDHGYVSEETVIRTMSAEFFGESQIDEAGNIVRDKPPENPPPQETTLRFTYEYDARGNWIRKTMESRFKPDAEFTLTATSERTVTYY